MGVEKLRKGGGNGFMCQMGVYLVWCIIRPTQIWKQEHMWGMIVFLSLVQEKWCHASTPDLAGVEVREPQFSASPQGGGL